VFYIILSIGGGLTVKLVQILPLWFNKLIEQLFDYWQQEKAKSIKAWQAQSTLEKIKCSAWLIMALAICILWLFN
jgi:hypothetical protein